MGKKDVIKPGHFKLAGRLRPGQDIVQEDQKQEFATEQAREEDAAAEDAPLPGMKPKPKPTMAAGKGGGTGSVVKRRRK